MARINDSILQITKHCDWGVFTIGKGFWGVYDEQGDGRVEQEVQEVDRSDIASVFDAERDGDTAEVKEWEQDQGEYGIVWFWDKAGGYGCNGGAS
jgi:hypothetical protein